MRYRRIAQNYTIKFVMGVLSVVTQLTLAAVLGRNTQTLLLGQLIAYAAAAIVGAIFVRRQIQSISVKFALYESVEAIKRYYRFPVIEMWGALLSTLTSQLPVSILAISYGQFVVGQFAMAQRILAIPVGLFSASLSQVFFQRIAALRREGRSIYAITRQMFNVLLASSVLVLGVIALVAPGVSQSILGTPWTQTGYFIREIAPMSIFALVFVPIAFVLVVSEKQRETLFAHIFLFLAPTAVLSICGLWLRISPHATVLAYASASGLVYFMLTVWTMRIARRITVYSVTEQRKISNDAI
jgi:lipopolysaccharide exporter